ncbi:MAG TPA: cation:dicarboxylase symporter family transporter, partial [Micavibrio sp.]
NPAGALRESLLKGDSGRAEIVSNVLGFGPSVNDNDFAASLDFEKLAAILKAFEENGLSVDPEKAKGGLRSPLEQKAFFDAVRAGQESAETLHQQILDIHARRAAEKDDADFKEFSSLAGILPDMAQDCLYDLRTKCKSEAGFLKTAFGIFASKDPAEKATQNLAAFDRHCRENGITFDEAAQLLVAGEKPKTTVDHIKEWRFAMAAIGGGILGGAGLDLGTVPVLKDSVGLFFNTGLPWMAAGFIGLNMYRAFSENSILKQAGTIARFGAITAGGLAVGYVTTLTMNNILPPVDVSSMKEMTVAIGGDGSFNPMQYMLYIVGAAAAFAGLHKGAVSSLTDNFNADAKGGIGNTISRMAFNDSTVQPILGAGQAAIKGADFFNVAFPAFISYVGLPAIATIMSHNLAEGGLDQLGIYGNYYATVLTGFAGVAAMLGGIYYASGCRGNDFKEIGRVMKEGFCLSSSTAALPKERIAMLNIGVPEKTVNQILPLAAVFGMAGTSAYLWITQGVWAHAFNLDPSFSTQLETAATIFAIAMSAPGVPASTISLLDPVLQPLDLSARQTSQIFASVVLADRLILDPGMSGLNAIGDVGPIILEARDEIRAKNKVEDVWFPALRKMIGLAPKLNKTAGDQQPSHASPSPGGRGPG